MTKLTKHFHDYEFSCPCCGKNIVAGELVAKLQELRDIIGEPIFVTSGYRCFTENKKVGGAINSAHTKGLGADIQVKGWLPMPFAVIANRVNGIRIGIYPNHIHIDIVKPHPSKYWLVRKYGQKPIYSGNEKNLAKFLKNNL